jgi:HPt (histidine-containing phosphotransfer) domain-containing protein
MNSQDMPVLDDDQVQQLLKEMGDAADEVMSSLIESFEHDIQKNIAEMWAAVDAESHDRLRRAAHGLKGSAASLGAVVMVSICLELEHVDNRSELASLAPRINQLEALCVRSVDALNMLIS